MSLAKNVCQASTKKIFVSNINFLKTSLKTMKPKDAWFRSVDWVKPLIKDCIQDVGESHGLFKFGFYSVTCIIGFAICTALFPMESN